MKRPDKEFKRAMAGYQVVPPSAYGNALEVTDMLDEQLAGVRRVLLADAAGIMPATDISSAPVHVIMLWYATEQDEH